MPLRWSQVTARLEPARFTIKTALKRIAADGDPLAPVLDQAIPVEGLLGGLAERLG
jgi:bifunctional non-homologous end joining protein LigD